MNISYIIHKIPKDGFFSLAISIKNGGTILSGDKIAQLGGLDKKIVEALIKDYNAHKALKLAPLEYGSFDKIPVSDKQITFFLTELAKAKEVFFESKKLIIDALSFSKLCYQITLTEEQAEIKAHIVDGFSNIPLEDIDLFLGHTPVWLLHKGVLKKLKQEFKWLKIALEKIPLVGKKQEDLLDHYENELPIANGVPEAKFIYQKASMISPCPIIELSNDRGLFFQLKFDYQQKGRFYFKQAPETILNKEEELFWEKILLDLGVKKNSQEYYISSIDQDKLFKQFIQEGFLIVHVNGKSIVIVDTISSTLLDTEDGCEFDIALGHQDQKATLDDILVSTLKKSPLVSLGTKTLGLVPLSILSDLEVLFRAKKQGEKLIVKPHLKGDFLIPSLNVIDKTVLDISSLKFEHFTLALLDFQKEGVAWLLSHITKGFSCLLADDMGLGKTIQVLAVIDLIKPFIKQGVLIICPKSIKGQWQDSINKYLKGINVPFTIMSFHELRASENSLECSLCIVDEAQGIKNANTLVFQKCSEIKASYKIALSGTPIENSIKDLVTIFEFLAPNLVEEFRGMNATLNRQKISRRLAPFIKRRLKQQVLHQLPELFEQECLIEMEKTQADIYYGLIEQAKQNPTHAFSLLTSLRLAALDERLIHPDQKGPSSKTWQVIEDICQIHESCQKVIVFSQFTSYLALIRQHLDQLGLQYAYLDGSTKNREAVIEEFFGLKQILVMSLKAGGVGLNLQAADYVLLLDPWWHEAIEKQAIDRAYRLGRQKPVVAKRYVTLGTLEIKIKDLKASKMALLDELDTSSQKGHEALLELFN